MKWFGKKEKPGAAVSVQTAPADPMADLWRGTACAGAGERRLYEALRDHVPVIDASIDKITRLVGSFTVACPCGKTERDLNGFLRTVRVNAASRGVQSFLNSYLAQLLTYGNAVGEMVLSRAGELEALYNASLDDVELREASPLRIEVCRRGAGGWEPARYQELLLVSALNPPPGSAKGVSLLHGLPFVSGILMQIYRSMGMNWERMGNVRFAVTYQPSADAADRAFAKERAEQIAREWSRAMRKDTVSDFIAVGNVSIKAIGADNQILDSSVPVRQMLEQIVAKLGLPPFLLGLSWSSTERMSSQQADILTSELEAYRRELNPVIDRICSLWLRLNGRDPEFEILWDDITLQDEVDLANTRLVRAQALEIEKDLPESAADAPKRAADTERRARKTECNCQ